MKTSSYGIRVFILAFWGLAVLGPGLQAQRLPQQTFKQLTKKVAQETKKAVRAAVGRAQAAVHSAKISKQLASGAYDAQLVKNNIGSAVFFMYTPLAQSSGFFLEEYYLGERFVWAVIPAHAVGNKFALFSAEYMGLDGEIHRQTLRVVSYGSSGYQNYDFALAPVPPDMQKEVFALRLAQESPQKGDKVSSFGFYALDEEAEFAGPPKENTGRVILSVDNSRLTTSYPFENQNPAGACGGPLLNEKGEVVGIHSGSRGSCSFAVEATGSVREMLSDVHGDRVLRRSVMWNGKLITRLASSQRISRIVIKRDGQIIDHMLLTKRETPFDYSALEQLFPQACKGDIIYLALKDQRAKEIKILEFVVK